MNEAFNADTEDSRRMLLAQAEAALTAALEQYDLQEREIAFIQVSEHVTYRIEDAEGKSYLLRIHPGTAPSREIASEMEWLSYLSKVHGLQVPTGVANRAGLSLTEVETERGRQWKVTVLHWIEGDHFEGQFSEDQIRQMGALMARMHQAASVFEAPEGFVRPIWDEAPFEQAVGRLKKHYRSYLNEEEFHLYEQAAAKVTAHMSTLERTADTFGMIHADYHEGNLIFHEGEFHPIDFGRCGYGYYMYDLAQAFIGLFPLQRALFLEGYESVMPVSFGPDGVHVLETFFIKSLIENQSYHAPHSWETAELRDSKPYSVALIRHYLEFKPFLYNGIPV
ncbi:phosphotransferase [Paenibacillus chibensis]|uniref:Phosphotransferase n=1 Tax=Paenibacillus chibensis TaxID=59846 RepID=A0ABU6PP28_9BACL|nr:phosphotransferase [Paenibacillus chibensis]